MSAENPSSPTHEAEAHQAYTKAIGEQIDQGVDFGRRDCSLPPIVPDRRAGSEDRGARELALDAALGLDPRAVRGAIAGGEIAQGSIDGRTRRRVLQSCERDEKKGDPVWH